MTIKALMTSTVLALSLSACTTQIIYADSPDSDGQESPPGSSSFGPPIDPTTGASEPDEATTGLVESTGSSSSSTGTAESSETGAASSSSGSSTGEAASTGPGEVAVDCPFSGECEGGVCAPDGSCVAACMEDGRCAGDELCLGGGCVDVGGDMMEAQLVGFNDSPVGAVSAFDTDVWKVKIPQAGNYFVTVSGKPMSAFVLSGMGDIIATPADAMKLDMEGMNSQYSITVEDASLPIAVLLMSDSMVPVAYWFYMVKSP